MQLPHLSLDVFFLASSSTSKFPHVKSTHCMLVFLHLLSLSLSLFLLFFCPSVTFELLLVKRGELFFLVALVTTSNFYYSSLHILIAMCYPCLPLLLSFSMLLFTTIAFITLPYNTITLSPTHQYTLMMMMMMTTRYLDVCNTTTLTIFPFVVFS